MGWGGGSFLFFEADLEKHTILLCGQSGSGRVVWAKKIQKGHVEWFLFSQRCPASSLVLYRCVFKEGTKMCRLVDVPSSLESFGGLPNYLSYTSICVCVVSHSYTPSCR